MSTDTPKSEKDLDHQLINLAQNERSLQQKDVELFNTHQLSTRNQAEFLSKSIFLIAGATLSLSMNLFLSDKAPKLQQGQLCSLRWAWIALFLSIIFEVIMFGVIIIRDYVFGERWRKQLKGGKRAEHLKWPDVAMWIAGVFGVIAFIAGMVIMASLSYNIVGSK